MLLIERQEGHLACKYDYAWTVPKESPFRQPGSTLSGVKKLPIKIAIAVSNSDSIGSSILCGF